MMDGADDVPLLIDYDPVISALVRQARRIWGPRLPFTPLVTTLLQVPLGDVARLVREWKAGAPLLKDQVGRELANLILTSLRLIDDLGLSPTECLRAALVSQQRYVGTHPTAEDWARYGKAGE